jgi:hypothetical protein
VNILKEKVLSEASMSVADPHHVDAVADSDPIYHVDADPNADPDPDF